MTLSRDCIAEVFSFLDYAADSWLLSLFNEKNKAYITRHWLRFTKQEVKTDKYGTIRYSTNGKLHRIDGPAEIYANGDQFWYQNGLLYRTDGPAVIYTSGTQWWYQNNIIHRIDGPAVIYYNGTQWWYQNGLLHRTDGPAVLTADQCEWWIDGIWQF